MRTHVFVHIIMEYTPSSVTEILRRSYPKGFNKFAMIWFDKEVLYRYPDAKRIEDKTIAGHHFEFEEKVFELR